MSERKNPQFKDALDRGSTANELNSDNAFSDSGLNNLEKTRQSVNKEKSK